MRECSAGDQQADRCTGAGRHGAIDPVVAAAHGREATTAMSSSTRSPSAALGTNAVIVHANALGESRMAAQVMKVRGLR